MHIFDPFFTTKPGGTGLGLSIVRKILEQHEGVIHVRSNDASGTTVQVELGNKIQGVRLIGTLARGFPREELGT